MARFKDPTFEERAAAGRNAKARMLENLRDKAVAREGAVTAPKAPGRDARAAADAERRAAYRASIDEAKSARKTARSEIAVAAERAAEARRPAPPPALPSADEMKAARDARYAARKAR